MSTNNGEKWQFNKQVNLSTLVQLFFLASLIITSWVNLQTQLDSIEKDVQMLLTCQNSSKEKMEKLTTESISFDYRIKAIEKSLSNYDIVNK
jgi:hypothetical protein